MDSLDDVMLNVLFLFDVVLLLGFRGIQCNGMTNKTTHVGAAVKEEQFLSNEKLQETLKELLISNSELVKAQTKLISSQSELQNRIKHLEVEVEHFKRKDRMQRAATSHVGFTARLTQTLTFGPGLNHQTLVFDNVYINVGNGYDASTGVFHAPVAGMYVILLTVSGELDFFSPDVEVFHNGQFVCRGVAEANFGTGGCNAVVRLQVGDAVLVRGIPYRPSDRIRGGYTTFSMGLLTKDDEGGSSF